MTPRCFQWASPENSELGPLTMHRSEVATGAGACLPLENHLVARQRKQLFKPQASRLVELAIAAWRRRLRPAHGLEDELGLCGPEVLGYARWALARRRPAACGGACGIADAAGGAPGASDDVGDPLVESRTVLGHARWALARRRPAVCGGACGIADA
eukprot:CAMPEP_0183393606 /NCGR_PEP_ID=MMETSP0370-20130417/8039_1 /TAXON_ID=268820 /ORGANISM="Peridinium aciculiferum, Strain PAER-2" /LENGTH=156 /DNA_ID=CAMNT_0025573849 /DNA_START=251 /DNA_END=718 /DNA_ORIENTATION=+